MPKSLSGNPRPYLSSRLRFCRQRIFPNKIVVVSYTIYGCMKWNAQLSQTMFNSLSICRMACKSPHNFCKTSQIICYTRKWSGYKKLVSDYFIGKSRDKTLWSGAISLHKPSLMTTQYTFIRSPKLVKSFIPFIHGDETVTEELWGSDSEELKQTNFTISVKIRKFT